MKTMYIKMLTSFGDPNSLDPWNITLWGYEVLSNLQERQLASLYVNRDYTIDVHRFGQTINARVRADMQWRRRNIGNAIKKQALVGTTVPVELDQLWHTAFVVDDWGSTRTFQGIIDEYLTPAAEALSRGINVSLLSQGVHFLNRRAGSLNGLSNSNAISYLTAFNGAMNAGQDWGGAPLFIDNDTRTTLMNVEAFHKVNEAGDSAVLKRARLGEKFDMDLLKTSDVPGNRSLAPAASTTVDGAKAKGSTTVLLTSGTGFTAGKRISIAGRPYKITALSTNTVTIEGGLLEDVDTGVAALAYPLNAIDKAAGYAAGHAEELVFDDPLVKGDVIDIVDADGYETYVVAQVSTGGVWLDRPLKKAVAHEAVVSTWPAGAYNFGFAPNSILMAARALPAAPADTGVRSTVVNFRGFAMRINLQYDADFEQMLVSLSILGGLAPVMKEQGGVMLT